jgi:hypothetical protein
MEKIEGDDLSARLRQRIADADAVPTGPSAETLRRLDAANDLSNPANRPPAPAPSPAEDVAALREEIYTFADKSAEIVGAAEQAGGAEVDALQVELDALSFSLEARLDRIAAAALPQRATNLDGETLWQHGCGNVGRGASDRSPSWCPATYGCNEDERTGWRALYVLPDGVLPS